MYILGYLAMSQQTNKTKKPKPQQHNQIQNKEHPTTTTSVLEAVPGEMHVSGSVTWFIKKCILGCRFVVLFWYFGMKYLT